MAGMTEKMGEMSFRTSVYAAYGIALERTKSREKALGEALGVLMGRKPFSALKSDDATFLCKTFAPFARAERAICALLWEADRTRDAGPLQDREFVTEIAVRLKENEPTDADTVEVNDRIIAECNARSKGRGSGCASVIMLAVSACVLVTLLS